MSSLDVVSLFTNILLDETINIFIGLIYNENQVIDRISKRYLRNMLILSKNEPYFISNELLYGEKDGVTMGYPLGPTFANAFLCFYKEKCETILYNISQFIMGDMIMIFLFYLS